MRIYSAWLTVLLISTCAAIVAAPAVLPAVVSAGDLSPQAARAPAVKVIAGWPRQVYVVEVEPFDTLGGTRQLTAVRAAWDCVYDASVTVSGGFSAGAILELDASLIPIPSGEYTPLTFSRRRADDWLASVSGAGTSHACLAAELSGAEVRWTGPGVAARFSGAGAPATLHVRCAAYGSAYGANGSVSYLSTPVPAMLSIVYEWEIIGVDGTIGYSPVRTRVIHALADDLPAESCSTFFGAEIAITDGGD
ncbi:MAG: hypothetical protein KF847_19880 [Pirellulales bacterium]|nr:hypothetical protein [Pirellulales bacterium]